MIADRTSLALHAGLLGLSLQRRAHEDNLANLDAPGYRASHVEFDRALSRAIAAGDPMIMRPSVVQSAAPSRLNGNNVNVDQELVALTENGLRHQLLVESLNSRYRILRTAITGQ